MFDVVFYQNREGVSELMNYLDDLAQRSLTEKNARIQLKQIMFYIQLLKDHGTRLGSNIIKYIDNDIWELRPGDNRVLFFYFKDNKFVLLHHFRKKTQKTPKKEVERAKAERDDWIARYN